MRNKHRLFIALLLAVCILFGSCNTANLPNENANATTPDTTAETTPTVNEDEAYLKIPVEKGIFSFDDIVELIGMYL